MSSNVVLSFGAYVREEQTACLTPALRLLARIYAWSHSHLELWGEHGPWQTSLWGRKAISLSELRKIHKIKQIACTDQDVPLI